MLSIHQHIFGRIALISFGTTLLWFSLWATRTMEEESPADIPKFPVTERRDRIIPDHDSPLAADVAGRARVSPVFGLLMAAPFVERPRRYPVVAPHVAQESAH